MAEADPVVTARYELSLSDMVWSNLWAISRFRALKLVAAFMVIGVVGWLARLASGDPSAIPNFRVIIVVAIALSVPLSVYWGTVQAYRKLKPEQLRKEFRFSRPRPRSASRAAPSERPELARRSSKSPAASG